MMLLFLGLSAIVYVVLGQLMLLSSQLEMRTVCPRIWNTPGVYCFASMVWPLVLLWIHHKWQRKKNASI